MIYSFSLPHNSSSHSHFSLPHNSGKAATCAPAVSFVGVSSCSSLGRRSPPPSSPRSPWVWVWVLWQARAAKELVVVVLWRLGAGAAGF
uniref:Uncharacterized protein n=1 Tax=Fagus sylvatica TaxID=28930 RepID=A0A2N9J444_FAGSY